MKPRTLILGALILALVAIPVIAQEGGEKQDTGPNLRTLKKQLLKAINSQDKVAIEEALSEYRAKGGRDAVQSLVSTLKQIPTNLNTVYWQVVAGIAAFRDGEALDEVAEQILANRKNSLSRDLMFGLARNRSVRVIRVHRAILAQGSSDLQQMSIDQLADIRHVESVDAIVEALRAGTIKESVLWWTERTLEILTGANMGRDGERWHEWWKVQREKGLPPPEEEDNTGMVTDHLDPIRKFQFKVLKKMEPGGVLVLNVQHGGCDYDNIEAILEQMEIPHTVVKREDFEKDETKLDGVMAIIINCCQIKEHCICPKCKPGGTKQDRLYKCTGCNEHKVISHALGQKGIAKVKKFVESGGSLFTEDWVLKEVLEKAWKQIVNSGKYLREQHVDIYPARGMTSHPMMRGVFIDPAEEVPEDPEGEEGEDDDEKTIDKEEQEELEERLKKLEHQWKIDDESPYLRIRTTSAVTVLLESDKVGKLSGGNKAVAITFFPRATKYGSGAAGDGVERRPSGRVVHVVSHFGKQESREDEFALQNLLLNFLLEANKFHNEKKKQ